MKLRYIKAQGFRSFCEPVEIDFCDLTMLIGNNDVGKSSILDILELALSSSKSPDAKKDFYTCQAGENAEEITVILQFQVDTDEEDTLRLAIGDTITYKVVYTTDNVVRQILSLVPVEEDLRCDFQNLLAQPQKDLIEKFDPEALQEATNASKRYEWFQEFTANIEKGEGWSDIPPGFLRLLPRIQRYSAMDYSEPEKLIERTVRQVFESVLYEEMNVNEQGDRKLRSDLQDLEKEAEQKINQKVSELQEYIQKYAPMVRNISYEPQIDFARGFQSGAFKVDEGRGEHYLNKSGDGTKRKIFMATTDWDREVTLSMQSEGGSLPDVIRAYDEPDTNLDYQAQHHLYRSIVDIVSGEDSNIQAIICTHSPRMIDRAPAQNIRMLKADEGKTVVEKIDTSNDTEVEAFLTEIARELGITNTLMFYENCFILVEGETEENALPLFYRTIYGRSLLEDGINIINVKGKGAFKEFLRLLSRNKQELAVFFMDTDCAETNDDKMTKQVLRENGFPEETCGARIILVGQQEFEDRFSPQVLVKAFNKRWPKPEGEWVEDDIPEYDPDKKYSKLLSSSVHNLCKKTGERWSKPDLGLVLGRVCLESEIPEKVKELFELAREVANISQ